MAPPIRLLLADVDGTLVTQEKVLTDRAVLAVRRLGEARQSGFAVTSGRPPRGMSMLIDPLELTTPIAGFNGGLPRERQDMSVIEQRTVPKDLVTQWLFDLLGVVSRAYRLALPEGRLDRIPIAKGPHVDREASTVKFEPTLIAPDLRQKINR